MQTVQRAVRGPALHHLPCTYQNGAEDARGIMFANVSPTGNYSKFCGENRIAYALFCFLAALELGALLSVAAAAFAVGRWGEAVLR